MSLRKKNRPSLSGRKNVCTCSPSDIIYHWYIHMIFLASIWKLKNKYLNKDLTFRVQLPFFGKFKVPYNPFSIPNSTLPNSYIIFISGIYIIASGSICLLGQCIIIICMARWKIFWFLYFIDNDGTIQPNGLALLP